MFLQKIATATAILALSATMALSQVSPATNTAQGRRVALVVGVGDYDRVPDLANPISDARAIAAEFWRSGFEVIEILDPNIELLRAVIKVMGERLDPGAHVTFFFAGHGIQVGGRNYLLARDVSLKGGEAEAIKSAISAEEVTTSLAESGAALSIVVLDACRNNPFQEFAASAEGSDRSVGLVGGEATGLAPIEVDAENEFILSFSTSPGAVALDGPQGGNSPFTSTLIDIIREPDLEVKAVFDRVREIVSEKTDGKQVPWLYTELDSPFVFRTDSFAPGRGAGDIVDTLGLLPPSLVIEHALWRDAVLSGQAESYQLYLDEYPAGIFSERARERLAAGPGGAVPVLDDPGGVGRSVVSVAAGTRTRLSDILSVNEASALVSIRLQSGPEQLGFIGANDVPLASDVTLAAAEVQGLIIQADPRLSGSVGRMTLNLADGQITRRDIVVEYDTCDMVAGYPHDPNRVGRGARLELMRPRLAIEACRNAVVRYPNSVRFKAVLGRAFRRAGDYDAARHWNGLAVEQEYSAALAAAGKMEALGQGGPVHQEAAAEYFRRSAQLGDSWGMNALGEAYLFGRGVAPDPVRGVALIRSSAETGNDWAHTLMGRVYENGWGVPASDETAVGWYRRAAEMGDPSAKMELSDAYRDGKGVERDHAQAMQWIESAAGQGWTFAQARLGREYEIGELVAQDFKAAASWYEVAMAQGDPEGEYLLAQALLNGRGRPADPQLAVALLRLSAGKKNVQAAYLLAELHERGEVVEKDLPFAQEMYQKSWDLGFAPAARRLANAHIRAYDGTEDGAAAVAVLQATIAEHDDEWAIRDLAAILREGKAVAQDAKASAALTARAVAKGNLYAYRDHARNLEKGFGVKRDLAAAFEHMREAAEIQNAWARLDFARYLRDGVGTQADPVSAVLWFARAHILTDANAAALASEQATAFEVSVLVRAYARLAAPDTPMSDEAAHALLVQNGVDLGDRAAVFGAIADLARQAQ